MDQPHLEPLKQICKQDEEKLYDIQLMSEFKKRESL